MSYDLVFLRRERGQSFEDALESLEELDYDASADNSADASSVDAEAEAQLWARIVAGIREVQPGVEDNGGELIDDETSIQVRCFPDETAISVPYWHSGDAAQHVLQRMHAFAAVVERETGMEGYDPQLGMSVADAAEHIDAAVAIFDSTAAMLGRQAGRMG